LLNSQLFKKVKIEQKVFIFQRDTFTKMKINFLLISLVKAPPPVTTKAPAQVILLNLKMDSPKTQQLTVGTVKIL